MHNHSLVNLENPIASMQNYQDAFLGTSESKPISQRGRSLFKEGLGNWDPRFAPDTLRLRYLTPVG
jgi:hypothetical protein